MKVNFIALSSQKPGATTKDMADCRYLDTVVAVHSQRPAVALWHRTTAEQRRRRRSVSHETVVADVASSRNEVARVARERRRGFLGGCRRLWRWGTSARVSGGTQQCTEHGVLFIHVQHSCWNNDLCELIDTHCREVNQSQWVSKHLPSIRIKTTRKNWPGSGECMARHSPLNVSNCTLFSVRSPDPREQVSNG